MCGGGGCQKVQKSRTYFQFRASREDGFAGCTVRQKSNGGVSISHNGPVSLGEAAGHLEPFREIDGEKYIARETGDT